MIRKEESVDQTLFKDFTYNCETKQYWNEFIKDRKQ